MLPEYVRSLLRPVVRATYYSCRIELYAIRETTLFLRFLRMSSARSACQVSLKLLLSTVHKSCKSYTPLHELRETLLQQGAELLDLDI